LSPNESEPKTKTKHLREKHASSDTFSTAGTHPQKHKETLTPLLPDPETPAAAVSVSSHRQQTERNQPINK
jgi:hypothetical protein